MKTPARSNKTTEKLVMDAIAGAKRRYTLPDLERALSRQRGMPRRFVRQTVRALVSANMIVYTQIHGHTFLDISYRRPVPVGRGVVLAPPDLSFDPAPGQTLIRIAPGAAFGMGDHPTTRLALRMTAWAIGERQLIGHPADAAALDIGTGSGVLAICACLMGVGRAAGIDTESCARAEARENVRLNALQDRISISPAAPDALAGSFALILANLRWPTLSAMRGRILELAPRGGLLIFSGFRETETAGLVDAYTTSGAVLLRTRTENSWAAIALSIQKEG